MTALVVDVVGTPAPQGSHRGFVNPTNGRVIITQDSKKTKPWRQDVTAAAYNAIAECAGFEPFTGPVAVHVTFLMPRPKYHFRTGARANELKPTAPDWVDKKPDTDKLLRALLDSLTAAGVFRDDAQVADVHGTKRYAHGAPGAHIEITPLTAAPAVEGPAACAGDAGAATAGAAPTTDGGLF